MCCGAMEERSPNKNHQMGTKFTIEQVPLTSGTKMAVEGVELDKGYTTPAAVETFINPVKKTGNETISGVKTFASPPKSTGAISGTDPSEVPSLGDLDFRMIDPRIVIDRNDFFGTEGWVGSADSGGGFHAIPYQGSPQGACEVYTPGTIGTNSAAFRAHSGNLSLHPAVLSEWRMLSRVKLPSVSSVKARIGFSSTNNGYGNNLWSGGYVFVGLEFDSAVGANWYFVSDNGTTATRYDSGIVAVADTWAKISIRSSGGDSSCIWSINGAAETNSAITPLNATGFAFGVHTTENASKRLLLDYYNFGAKCNPSSRS